MCFKNVIITYAGKNRNETYIYQLYLNTILNSYNLTQSHRPNPRAAGPSTCPAGSPTPDPPQQCARDVSLVYPAHDATSRNGELS